MPVLTDAMADALNRQLNLEFGSASLYLAMSADLDARGLPGMSHWMRVQAQEELIHAMRVFDFVCERDGRVRLGTVPAPGGEWPSALATFEAALEHERAMTARLNDLSELAEKERDRATINMLRWFIDEQVEEEATLTDIVQRLRLVGDDGTGLYMVDRELSTRTLAAAQAAAAQG